MNHDERDKALDDDFRRASEADAGRPAAATRVAILAEAAAGAAARRRATPAANESRYWMRAVAGVAVVGVGILLWRQTDHRLPGEPQVMVAESMREEVAAPPPVGVAAAPTADTALTQSPPAAVSRQAAAAGAAADAVTTDQTFSREQRADQPTAAPPPMVAESRQKAAPPPAPAQAEEALAGVQSANPEAPAQDADRQQAAAPAASEVAQTVVPGVALGAGSASTEADALLRRHFPTQYQSDSAHRLWLVRNAAGDVVQMGDLAPGQTLADVTAQLQSDPPERRPAGWRTTSVTNARGQSIELSIGEIP